MTGIYKYSAENRIVNNCSCSYMYTPFEGREFFEFFFFSRKDFLAQAENRISGYRELTPLSMEIFDNGLKKLSDLSTGRDIKRISQIDIPVKLESLNKKAALFKSRPTADTDIPIVNPGEYLATVKVTDEVNTMNLVYSLFKSTSSEPLKEDTDPVKWMERLLGRFEVTKRIYENYLPGFRKGVGAFDRIINYSLYSYTLSAFYVENPTMKQLNALLKLNDLLCSISKDIFQNQPALIASYFSHMFEIVLAEDLLRKKNLI